MLLLLMGHMGQESLQGLSHKCGIAFSGDSILRTFLLSTSHAQTLALALQAYLKLHRMAILPARSVC